MFACKLRLFAGLISSFLSPIFMVVPAVTQTPKNAIAAAKEVSTE